MTADKMIAFGLFASLLGMLLRESKSRYAVILSVVAGIPLLLYALSEVYAILIPIRAVAENSGVSDEIGIAVKGIGCGYITEIGQSTCRELGESTLADKVQLCGRLSIIALAMPVFGELLRTALSYVS